MNVMNAAASRRMPSADWLAFGVALAAVFLKYLEPALMSIIALVVFLPSILRELGVLKDADEWTRGIMHRAGFHAALMVVAILTVNYVAVNAGWFEAGPDRRWPLEVQFFRLGVVWIFLVSYVIQYWGARDGVFRILLVVGAMNLAPAMILARGDQQMSWSQGGWLALLGGAIACVLFVGLAYLVRRRPRLGASVLLVILVASVVATMVTGLQGREPRQAWDFASSLLQHGIVLGVTAAALFLGERTATAD